MTHFRSPFEGFSQDWLPKNTIFLTQHGSHAYGTNTPESDMDLRGICIPPKEYFLSFTDNFEQATSMDKDTDLDVVIFGIHKFMHLASNCNPNIIEILFTDPDNWLTWQPKFFDKLMDSRDLFITQKARHTFCGYAMSQLKRIKTHRKWLLNPPTKKPTREDFGLPPKPVIDKKQLGAAESMIRKKVDSWELDLSDLDPARRIYLMDQVDIVLKDYELFNNKDVLAARSLGYDDNFIKIWQSEHQYKNAKNEWDRYQTWKRERNPKRAAMEAEYGYDLKHASHLVRLLTMAGEILSEGKVLVKRPDAQLLRDIKERGIWSYDQLIQWAEDKQREITALEAESKLPKKPDISKLRDLCMEIVELHLSSQ